MKYYVYDHKKRMVVDIFPIPYYKAKIIPAYDDIYASHNECRFTLCVGKEVVPR